MSLGDRQLAPASETAHAWSGVISGVALITMGALDLAGALIGQPPAGMKVVDALMVALGAVIAWRTWALLHPRTR